jgi:hypothetical protein
MRCFASLDTSLRKLPRFLTRPTRPKQLAVTVGNDDTNVRPKAIGVYHSVHLSSIVVDIILPQSEKGHQYALSQPAIKP